MKRQYAIWTFTFLLFLIFGPLVFQIFALPLLPHDWVSVETIKGLVVLWTFFSGWFAILVICCVMIWLIE